MEELRGVMDKTMRLSAPNDVLAALTTQLNALNQQMAAYTTGKPVPQFNMMDMTLPPNDFLPYSPVSGALNPIAPPLDIKQEGDKLIGRCTLGDLYEGPPNCVHGAIIAAVYDQLLAFFNVMQIGPGPTAFLHINYREVTPLHEALRFEAWIDRQEGRKVYIQGACFAGEKKVSDCEGLFILITPGEGAWKQKD